VIIISALTRDRVIGAGPGMPWNIPEEYRHFLETVHGQTVLMGRRSWEIFGGDLTSAHNVVVSRSVRELPGATVASGIAAALQVARGFGKAVFSAGGARIYEQTLPLATEMRLSWIEGDFRGDAYFPEFDPDSWQVTGSTDHPGFELVTYRRKTP
jgi:dihydrofolate reductase